MIDLELNVPNLDTAPDGELNILRHTFLALADYCQFRRIASHHRHKGDIPAAIRAEASADRVYQQLPPWARW
jgi:hypothetical protein